MNNPKVTIAIPVYKVELYIERCAVSLFEQTYDNIEYLFINDCTPDASITILENVIARYPNRKEEIKIINHKKNKGLAVARNTAIENCSSEYIMHVDSDDYLDITTVECLEIKLKENDNDIISYNFKVIRKNNEEIWEHPHYRDSKEMTLSILKRNTPVCVCGRLIKVELYKKNNIMAIDNINMSEDYTVTTRLAYHAKNVCTIPIPLYYYDCTNESSYTHIITTDKVNQDWKAVEYVESFFKDKGEEYIDSIVYAKLTYIYRQLIELSLNNNVENTQTFYFLHTKLSEFSKEYIKKMPLSVRLVFKIKNIFCLKTLIKIKRLLKKF